MIYNIVLGSYLPENYEGYLVGVDFSTYNLLKNGFDLFLGIGDFDSISDDDFIFVQNSSQNVVKLDTIKDETDLEAAILWILNYDVNAEIIVHNFSFGNRIDHLYSIFNLLRTYNVTLLNKNNRVFVLENNNSFVSTQKYLSFYALENIVDLSISNLKYEIKNINMSILDRKYVSNESTSLIHDVFFKSGRLLVIESSD